jgi:hypothetical protein
MVAREQEYRRCKLGTALHELNSRLFPEEQASIFQLVWLKNRFNIGINQINAFRLLPNN